MHAAPESPLSMEAEADKREWIMQGMLWLLIYQIVVIFAPQFKTYGMLLKKWCKIWGLLTMRKNMMFISISLRERILLIMQFFFLVLSVSVVYRWII